jgi:hypothetical protein
MEDCLEIDAIQERIESLELERFLLVKLVYDQKESPSWMLPRVESIFDNKIYSNLSISNKLRDFEKKKFIHIEGYPEQYNDILDRIVLEYKVLEQEEMVLELVKISALLQVLQDKRTGENMNPIDALSDSVRNIIEEYKRTELKAVGDYVLYSDGVIFYKDMSIKLQGRLRRMLELFIMREGQEVSLESLGAAAQEHAINNDDYAEPSINIKTISKYVSALNDVLIDYTGYKPITPVNRNRVFHVKNPNT